jgi:hypothetical protein
MARTNRRTITVAASLAFGVGLAGAACVIADPPAEIPVPPLAPPEILDDLVVPPPPLLQAWPLEFKIPIYVPDPSSSVEYHVFLDYDPIARPGFYANGSLDPDPADDDGGVRILTRSFPEPADLNACHTLQVLVALTFIEDHTPDSVGGDSITWIYSPTNNLMDCPVYDAGPYDAALDSSADGDDGSDAGDGAEE